MPGRFSTTPFQSHQLKNEIRSSKDYRLNCRRGVNRLLMGGGDSVEVFADYATVYKFTMKFSGSNQMLKFPFDICVDTVQKIYEEILAEAGKIVDTANLSRHEQAILHAKKSLTDQRVRKMFCSKMMAIIRQKRNENRFETEEKKGRFIAVYNEKGRKCVQNSCDFVNEE